MITDQPEVFEPETERTTETEKTFAVMFGGNDDATEAVMDDYPEYWIG